MTVWWGGAESREVLHGVGADGAGVKFHFCSKLLLFAFVLKEKQRTAKKKGKNALKKVKDAQKRGQMR